MGVYWMVVCHKCRVYYMPALRKEREILLNNRIVADVGRFFIEHRHSDDQGFVQMVADEYDYGWGRWDDYESYKRQSVVDKGE